MQKEGKIMSNATPDETLPIVQRLRLRATIRRQISTRKSVQENKPDRISDLLEEAADEIERLEKLCELKDSFHWETLVGEMKVYAAKHTDCYHEYGPAVFSLHHTKEGAQRAIAKSQAASRTAFQEGQDYWQHQLESGEIEGVFGREDEWTFEDGNGFERWVISEIEVEE
jgi:hypothetical protein